MIGDLVSPGPITANGKHVADILLGKAEPQSSETYPLLGIIVPLKGTAACAKDTCCIWKYIADEMANQFRGPLGKCNKFARYAVRGGFHDAGKIFHIIPRFSWLLKELQVHGRRACHLAALIAVLSLRMKSLVPTTRDWRRLFLCISNGKYLHVAFLILAYSNP